MAPTNLRQSSSQTFFASKCLSSLAHGESSSASANSNMKNMTTEEIKGSSRESRTLSDGEHLRPTSDVPLGFSAMMQSSPQLVPISGQGSSARANNLAKNLGNDKLIGIDSIVGIKTEGDVADDMLNSFMNMDRADGFNSVADAGTSKSELEPVMRHGSSSKERVERNALESIVPQFQHYRSLSMDSSIRHFQFDGSPNMMFDRAGQLSQSNSLSENLAKINLDFGSGEFNEFELKKIMSDERLAEIVTSDPKRVKRILANRQSAARSKERKLRYISELEHKVRILQTEATKLSTQITVLQKDNADLASLNKELKLHIQAMQQQAQLRDALHNSLTAEVQHLKHANVEYREDGGKSNGDAHQAPTKRHMFPMSGQ